MKKICMCLVFSAVANFASAADMSMSEPVAEIAHQWATINYQTPEKDREAAYKDLAAKAAQLVETSPGKPEPMVWEAIVLASYAKADGGLGALSMVRKARDLLLAAEKIAPNTLNGSVYTSLGSLYAKVPGWPIGFGDSKKARQYLETALQINPDGIDVHYFYGDFLADQGEYAKAAEQLKLAAAAKPRPGREDADVGRHVDINALLAKLRKDHSAQLASQ